MTYPDLLLEYLEFCKLRNIYSRSSPLGLAEDTPITITTLLPLQTMIQSDIEKKVLPSSISTVRNVMDLDFGRVNIPTYQLGAEQVFSTIMTNNDPNNYGGNNAFLYMLAEVIDNVYQHSGFSNGSAAAYVSPSRRFSDLSIFDDGITIRKRLHDTGMLFSHDSEAIVYAINGLSSKPGRERGYGLRTTAKLVIDALNGQLFIMSGSGAVYASRDIKERYDFGNKDHLAGTLITFRVPYPCGPVDIFKYVG